MEVVTSLELTGSTDVEFTIGPVGTTEVEVKAELVESVEMV